MNKKIGIALLVGILGLLGACNQEESEPITEAPEIFQLEADLTATETAEVGGTVAMKTIVTQGEEKIDDADEVVYEIWEEGKKAEGEMIDSINEGEGVYTAETSFDHDGLFHIQVHVTANAQHTMPLVEVTVGDGGNYEEADVEENHHAEGFSMHFMKPEDIKTSEETDFVVHVQLDKDALEGANVRYEIWDESSEAAHDWVDTSETTAGEYAATHVFEEAGTYTVQIHVENVDGLHEHEEHEIEVQ